MPDRLLPLVGTPALEAEPAPIGTAIQFARLVARSEHVDDSLFQQMSELFSNEAMTELTAAIGYYGLLARILNTFQVPLEDGIVAQPFPSHCD